jgi:glycosyltransferase involved in cell wall biosynthesis
MAAFDVFVHPSLWEGFGIVLLEAMALDLPIVASDVSAIPEIILNGQTGLLVPPGDPPGLAAAIIRLYRDEELAKALGQAGQLRLARYFSLNEMVRKTIEVYEGLL